VCAAQDRLSEVASHLLGMLDALDDVHLPMCIGVLADISCGHQRGRVALAQSDSLFLSLRRVLSSPATLAQTETRHSALVILQARGGRMQEAPSHRVACQLLHRSPAWRSAACIAAAAR